MIKYGRSIYTDIDRTSDVFTPIESSIRSMSSNNYFESLIDNCIQFFDTKYLYMSYDEASSIELERILKEPDRTNNIGRLIYNIYYSLLGIGKNGNTIKQFILENFFNNTPDSMNSIVCLYWLKIKKISALSKRFDLQFIDYIRIAELVNKLVTGTNYEFSKIGIPCTVYKSGEFDIKPSTFYQVALSYNVIILSHNRSNKDFWEIDPIEINGHQYTDLEKCLDVLNEQKILILSCNDNRHTLTRVRPGSDITVPKYALISELYIEN